MASRSQTLPAHISTSKKDDDAGSEQNNERFLRVLTSTSKAHEGHIGRRVFIGPMPEKVISHLEHEIRRKKDDSGALSLNQLETAAPGESEDVVKLVRHHVRRFTAHYKPRRDKAQRKPTAADSDDDWDDEYEQNLTEEMIQKWKESEWGKAWSHRLSKKTELRQPANHWVGGSFEIGSLLGVNVLHGGHSKPYAAQRAAAAASTSRIPDIVLTGPEAPQQPSSGGSVADQSSSLQSPSADSRKGLLASGPRRSQTLPILTGKGASSADLRKVTPSDTQISAKAQGKRPQIHVTGEESPMESSRSTDSEPPAPPVEVLQRSESAMGQKTSQGAMLTPLQESQWGEVIMRDRMLVRIAYSKSEGLSPQFDDSIHRTTRDLQYEDWGEFLVAWRKDLIEIYEDYRMPGRELMAGAKHLVFVIPLKAVRTSLSMYSYVDLTFCLTCAPMSTRINSSAHRIFNRSRPGTNIFIFKHKSRSRTWDWIWKLWRYRGGDIPPSIDIHNPRLNSRVTVDVPFRKEIDHQELFDMFTRKNIVALCIQSLRSLPDWVALIEHEITQHGKRLEVCWRRGATLDWIWLEEDPFGNPRPWAAIAGLAALQSSRPPTLEIRLTSHAPTHYHLKNGTEIVQPPSVEGYVERIKPNTQFKQSLYLSTHNGVLFTHHLDKAYPPAPPGLALTLQNLESWITGLRPAEVQRGINQVLNATGVCDLRNIVAVRRAFQLAPPTTHEQKDPTASGDADSWVDVWTYAAESPTMDDDEDEGGDTYLAQAHVDRAMVRIRRSFELLLNTGHVIRFETYSRKVAIEWVNRLRDLIAFWKHKHRMDAKEEMELVQARRPRLTPQIRVCHEEDAPPEAPADMSAPYPAMESLYNWCIIEGCNPITKGGRMYMRKGLRGQYKLVHMFLVAGHLVRFRIKPGSSLHAVVRKRINLLDAYVYSGYYAALNLPKGQFRPNKPAAPRRYQDGLETDDREEDMLLMILYRSQPAMTEAEQTPTVAPVQQKSVPALSTKQKVLVLRARSRIERDAWCWALNTEIEKVVRAQRVREEKMKDTGGLVELK